MIKKNPEYYIKALSFYQVSSGIFGLTKSFGTLSEHQIDLVIAHWFYILIVTILYTMYAISGVLLYRRHKIGLKLSKIVYLIQGIHFRINGFEFICTMFTNIFFYYHFPFGFGQSIQIGGETAIFFYSDTSINYIGINVISIVAIYLLHKIKSVEDYSSSTQKI